MIVLVITVYRRFFYELLRRGGYNIVSTGGSPIEMQALKV